jgi:hypothetical protein
VTGASRFQGGSRFCNRTFLHDSGPKQHHRLRLQLRVCPPRPDDGLNLSEEPRHVARRQFAASTYGLLHWHHRLGISHYASMLVGWCPVAEIVSCGRGAIRRCAERRRDCADDEPADVLVAFLDVGGEWFLMWQSRIWNGQEEAFRMFTIVGVVFLVVVQREPTPD